MVPTGNVTFLFSDIEGSTILAQKYPKTLQAALNRHHSILTGVLESFRGFIFELVGDAFCCAFKNPEDAVRAAAVIQHELAKEKWKEAIIKVRIGIHSGNAEWNGKMYTGYITMARTARIMSAAHGGQIIVSQSVMDVLSANGTEYKFRDMGERRLKDLIRPEHMYQPVFDDIPDEFPPLKTLDERQNNLPLNTTSFIGRVEELKQIRSLLSERRLLTLTGMGGTGKTRLALKTGAEVTDEFSDGVWFVELAPITDGKNIPNEIANVMDIISDTNQKDSDLIINFLKDKEALLILDNCEHLIQHIAEISNKLLSSCPKLKIMVTSRESLHLFEETVFSVHPLSLPDLKNKKEADLISLNESVRLFIERASSVRNDFKINDNNAGIIAELCHSLDGIPLAIELAAARVRVLTVEQIYEKIKDRFNILTSGSRSSMPHHQTLGTLIDWSYDMLNEDERKLFQRLSVFSGGWTLEAAEDICSDETTDAGSVMELLFNLVDKSLVNANESGGIQRYSMLETIRQYSGEKLTEKDKYNNRHLLYYLKLSTEKPGDETYDSLLRLRTVKSEFENIRTAIYRNFPLRPRKVIELVNQVGIAWDMNGNSSEGLEIYRKYFSLDMEFNDAISASAFMYAGCLASIFSEFDEAGDYLTRSMKIYESLNDRSNIGFCMNYTGNIFFAKNEYDTSRKYHEKALETGREIQDDGLIALSLADLATISRVHGNLKASRQQYEESLKLYRKLRDKIAAAQVLTQLASLEAMEGFAQKARSYFEESLKILKEYGNHIPFSITLLNLGNLSIQEKKYDEADFLFEECLSMAKQFGYNDIYIHALIKLAKSALQRRKYLKAKELLMNAISVCNPESDKHRLALCFEELGNCFFSMKKKNEAGRFYGIAAAVHESAGNKFSEERSGYSRSLRKIRDKRDAEEFISYFRKGKKINLNKAIESFVKNI